MRTHRSSSVPVLAAVALLAFGLSGCGRAAQRDTDSSNPPESQERVASVDVTYFYLPG